MNGIRESFLSLDLFSLRPYVQKIFYGPLTAGSPPPHGSVTDWDFSQSKWYTYWQHLAVQSTSRLRLCGLQWKTSCHTCTYCPSMNKSEVQSFSFGYFSETNRQNSSLSRCLFPRMKLSACTSQFHLLWRWLLLKRQHFSKLVRPSEKYVSSKCMYYRRHNKAIHLTYNYNKLFENWIIEIEWLISPGLPTAVAEYLQITGSVLQIVNLLTTDKR